MADWMDSKKYQYLNALPSSLLAWEFLRRSEQYIEAWSLLNNYYKGPLSSKLARKHGRTFGLSYLVDPAVKTPVDLIWDFSSTLPRIIDQDSLQTVQIKDSRILVEFNLTYDLSLQLKGAEKIARRQIRNNKIKTRVFGNNSKLFALYAQILDAKRAGAKDKEILNAIPKYSQISTADEQLRKHKIRAKRLAESGYLTLLLRHG